MPKITRTPPRKASKKAVSAPKSDEPKEPLRFMSAEPVSGVDSELAYEPVGALVDEIRDRPLESFEDWLAECAGACAKIKNKSDLFHTRASQIKIALQRIRNGESRTHREDAVIAAQIGSVKFDEPCIVFDMTVVRPGIMPAQSRCAMNIATVDVPAVLDAMIRAMKGYG